MEPMKQSLSYINSFFDDFLKDSSIEGAFYLKISLNEFLEHETKEKALAVFTCFFDCFRIHLEGRNFVDLLDALNAYEENSSVLLDKQRDHLIHSVNVFVLGLSVFAKNEHYARAFQTARVYPYNGALNSPSEEFLFRWGLAALLHDIGYPVEIINNQFKAFIKFIGESDGKKGADPFLDYFNFSAIDSIDEILYKSVFAKNFMKAIPSGIELDPLKPTHLLAYNFHTSLGVSFGEIRDKVMGFLPTMQKFGFVDHGYYSSLILLKWYGTLIQRTGLSPDVFYHPVLDSAGAIFLHNYYRNGIMKPPFSLGALSASSHPIAFLLILCDELQEWNRKAYGALDRKKILAETSQVEIGGESLRLHYLTSKGVMSESFGADKAAFLSDVLMISGVFPQGMTLTQTTNSELYMSAILENDKVIGRPLLSNLEAMAKIIHENYNKKREADGLKVDHPTWESLPDTLKYSNIRQARSVYSKLATCGLFISTDPPPDAVEVESFTLEEIESLARDEHDDWVSERLANGWTHGESDSKNKRSPYLIPYTALTEEIKEYDRDAVRNIFPILKRLGLRVYRNSDSYSELLAGE